MGRAEEAGLGAAAIRAVTSFRNVLQSLMATATDANVADIIEAVLDRTGFLEALEAERTIEARGRIENLEELIGVGREYDAAAQEPSLSASCRRSRSTRTRTRYVTIPTTAASSR